MSPRKGGKSLQRETFKTIENLPLTSRESTPVSFGKTRVTVSGRIDVVAGGRTVVVRKAPGATSLRGASAPFVRQTESVALFIPRRPPLGAFIKPPATRVVDDWDKLGYDVCDDTLTSGFASGDYSPAYHDHD